MTEGCVVNVVEFMEDYDLSKLAKKVDIEGAKTYSHEETWKNMEVINYKFKYGANNEFRE